MLPILVPVVIGLGGLAWWKAKKPHGMTPDRKRIFESAMATLKEPDKLRSLADSYEKEGLKDEAVLLRKRALLREMPPEVKAKRQQAFGKAMRSTDPKKVEMLASAFQKEGAVGAAKNLRKYAAGLRKAS